MSEHLPECCVGPNGCDTEPCQRCHACCICDELRACEERVMRAVMHTVDVDSYEEGKRDCKATHPVLALKEITRIASKGYDAGQRDCEQRMRGELLPPERTDGIISEDMRMATNLSMGKATAGSVATFLSMSPPDCPVTLSPDGIFLVVLNPPA